MSVRLKGGTKHWTDTGKITLTFEVEVVGRFSRYMDGQDIDGNRGVWRTELDHVQLTGVKCEDGVIDKNHLELLGYMLFGLIDQERIEWNNDGEEGE